MAQKQIPPPLPPSVEEAYRVKCIQLRERILEIEEDNERMILRKIRLQRSIDKMRLERAILTEKLLQVMKKKGLTTYEELIEHLSEGSSEGPPTVRDSPVQLIPETL